MKTLIFILEAWVGIGLGGALLWCLAMDKGPDFDVEEEMP